MDFSTTHSPPVVVNIDGSRYQVPRFRMRHFKAWAAARSKELLDRALAEYKDPEQRARFIQYWGEPLFDVAAIAEELTTPAGVAHVLETCLGEAGVPKETIDALIDNAPPIELRTLTGQLAAANKAVAQLQADSGDGGKGDDPLAGRQRTSDAAQQTGDSPPPDSPASSAAAMRIA